MPELIPIQNNSTRPPIYVPTLTVGGAENIQLQKPWDPGYDEKYRPEYNQIWHRSENQSWYGQMLNGLASRGLSIGTKVGAGFAAVAAMPEALWRGDMAEIWDNPIYQSFQGADEYLNELFPVYGSEKYDESGLWGKMGTMSFWSTDFMDGLAYAASAYVPGGVIGKSLGWAGEAMGGTKWGAYLLKGLSKAGVTGARTNLVAATAYNTVAEAAAEAYQTQKELETIYMDQGMSQEQAKKKAAEGATETFWWNNAVLLFPNFVQNRFFHGDWSDKIDAVRKHIWANKGVAGQMKELTALWKPITASMASEGLWEENVQTAVQAYERRMALGLEDPDSSMPGLIAQNMITNLKGFAKSFIPGMETSAMEDEGAVSIFLGAVIGGLFGGLGGARENAQVREAAKQEEARFKHLFGDAGPAAFNTLVEDSKSILKKPSTRTIEPTEEGGEPITVPVYETVTNDEGQEFLARDPQAIVRRTVNEMHNSNLWDAGMVAAWTNDPLMGTYNDHMGLMNFAFRLASDPNRYSAEEINQYLDSLTEIGTEEAKALGINTLIADNNEQIKKMIQTLGEIDKKYNTPATAEDADEFAYSSFMKKLEFFVRGKQEALDKLTQIATRPGTQEALIKMKEDNAELIRQLEEEQPQIKEEWFKIVGASRKQARRFMELDQIANKTEEQLQEQKALGYLAGEKSAVYGDYNIGDNTTAGYGVVTSPARLSKITPGTVDFYAYNLGRQELGLTDIERGLAEDDSAVALASKFVDTVFTESPRSQEAQSKILDKLGERGFTVESDIAANSAVSSGFADLVIGLGFQEDQTLRQVANDNEFVAKEMAKMLKQQTGQDVDIDQDLTPAEVEALSPHIDAIANQLAAAARELRSEQNSLQGLKARVASIFDTAKNSRQEKFNQAPDKQQFLINEYLENYVLNDYQALVDSFEAAEAQGRPFSDVVHFNRVLSKLKNAKAAFTIRKDISETLRQQALDQINAAIEYLNTVIYPAILDYNKRMGLVQQQAQFDAIQHSIEVLGLLNPKSDGYKPIEEVIGDELKTILELIRNEDGIGTYDGLMLLIHRLSDKADADQLGRIVTALENAKGKLIASMLASGLDVLDKRFKHYLSGKNYFATNPIFIASQLIEWLLPEQAKNEDSSIYAYLQELDLDNLIYRLEADTTLDEREKTLVRLIRSTALKINYANTVINGLKGTSLDVVKYLSLKESETEQVKPSLQQNIILNNIMQFLFTKIDDLGGFNNWLIFKGIGGSGKTLVISKLMTSLYQKLSNTSMRDKVKAISHTPETSANINRSIFGETNTPTDTFESVMALNNDQLSQLDFLVIDEVFAMTNDQVNQLQSKLIEHREATGHSIKVVAMGDPSQLVNEDNPMIMSSGAYRAKHTIPLTSSFRTNVGPITSFINNYRLNPKKVSDQPTQANIPLEDATADSSRAFGVQTASEDAMIDLLNNSKTTRTRVVIVPNMQEAARLRPRISPTIAMRLPNQVQGFQWDEVYVLGNPNAYGQDNININRALYTAFSRAKSYLVVDQQMDTTPLEANPAIEATLDDSADELLMTKQFAEAQQHQTDLVSEKLAVTKATGEDLSKDDTVVDPNVPIAGSNISRADIGSYAVYDDMENPRWQPMRLPIAQNDPYQGNSHVTAYPINYAFNDTTPNVAINAEAHIIRVREGNISVYHVVAPNENNPGTFIPVAVLGDRDFKDENNSTYFQQLSTAKPEAYLDSTKVRKDKSGMPINNIEALSLGTVRLENFRPLRAMYDMDNFIHSSELIDDVIKKFYYTFFGMDDAGRMNYTAEFGINPEKDWVVDDQVNWDLMRGKVKIRIFGKTGDNAPKEGVTIQAGVPYLIIEDPRQLANKETRVSKSIYIRLQPAKFSKNSRYYKPLREFYESVLFIEQLSGLNIELGTPEFNEVIQQYTKENFEVKSQTALAAHGLEEMTTVVKKQNAKSLREYFPQMLNDAEAERIITEHVDKIVILSHGADLVVKHFTDEEQAKALVGQVLNGKKIISYENVAREGKRPLYVLYYQADINSEEGKIYKEYELSARRGPAVNAFNNIAKGNEYVGGEQIRVKLRTKGGDQYTISRAKGLLSLEDAIDWPTFYEDLSDQIGKTEDEILAKGGYPYLINYLLKHKRGQTIMTMDGPVTIDTEKDIDELVRIYTALPVSSPLLGLVVGDYAFDQHGQHISEDENGNQSSLREPLHMDIINWLGGSSIKGNNPNAMDQEARKDLSRLLSSSFVGMSRTNVTLKLPLIGEQEPEPPTPTTLADVLDRIKPTGTQYLDQLVKMLRENSFIRAVPLQFETDIDGNKQTMVTYYNKKTGETRVVSSMALDTINNDAQLLSLFLHEAVHAATVGAITRVKAKKGSESDLKFYKAMSAIQRRFNAHVVFKLKLRLKDVYQKTAPGQKLDLKEFVANLSNPKFYKIASSKSIGDILLDALAAIAEWLGLTPKTSQYDAMIIVLKDHLDNINKMGGSPAVAVSAEQIETEVSDLYNKWKANVEARIKVLERTIEDLNEQDEDTSDVEAELKLLQDTESEIYDFKKGEVNKQFANADSMDRLRRIRLAAQRHGLYNDETASFAYYTPAADKASSSPGSILTTIAVKDFVRETFPDAEKNSEFLIRSVIQHQILYPGSEVLRTVVGLYNILQRSTSPDNVSKFMSYFYHEVLDWADRRKMRKDLNVRTDLEAVTALTEQYRTLEPAINMVKASKQLSDNYNNIKFLIASTVDKNIDRYIQAKRFILNELHNNVYSPEGRMKTKAEVIRTILAKVSDPKSKTASPYIAELQVQLEQAKTRAATLLANLGNAKAKIEYNTLVSETIPELENKLFALSSLGKKNMRTGKLLFFDILSDIYPKNVFTEEGDLELVTEDLEYTINDRGERELKEAANINEYMTDYSKSYELTLSESMKDFLSYIPVQGKTDTYLNAGLAYVKMLQLVTDLDWHGGTEGLRRILTQLSDRIRNKSMSSIDRTIVNALSNLISTALTTQDLSTMFALAENISIVTTVSQASGRVMYAAIHSPTNRAVNKMTYQEAVAAKDVAVSALTEDSAVLYEFLQKRLVDPLPVSVYNTLFRKAEAVNAIRELHNVMASMKETDLFITTRSNKRGASFANIRSKASGVSFGIKNDFISKLREMHLDDKLSGFKADFQSRNKKAWRALSSGTHTEKIEAISEFFSRFLPVGIAHDIAIPEDKVTQVANDVVGFIDRTTSVILSKYDNSTDADTAESESAGARQDKDKRFNNFRSYLEYMDGYLTRFSEIIYNSTDFVRNPSVRDSQGNKFYKFHESTWGDDVLNTLMMAKSNAAFKGTKGSSIYHSVPSFLRTDYYKHNIFVTGGNYIAAKGEHEASKNLDNGSVTPLNRENFFFFYHREFIQGFIDGMRQYGDEYFSYTYPPSDKPKHPMLRIKILHEKEITPAIESALRQIMEKQGTNFAIANYEDSLKNDLFRNFELGKKALEALNLTELTEDNISKVASKVKELMETRANEILNELTSDEVQLSFDVNTYRIFNDNLLSKLETKLEKYPDENFKSKIWKDGEGIYTVDKSEISPAFKLFFMNHYVNSYFLNQLITGDYAFYKKNSSDMVKRFAGVLAPGIRPLVDPEIGMKEDFNMLVLDDTTIPVSDTRAKLKELLYGNEELTEKDQKEFDRLMSFFSKSYDMSDAQGFMLPTRFNDLTRGYGRAWGMGNVMKPVYFEVQAVEMTREDGTKYTTGVPIYVKYSSINLEDSLVDNFPILGKLRQRMIEAKADELVFKSAVKEGIPLRQELTFRDFIDRETIDDLDLPMLQLKNRHYRFQHNAASDPNKSIAIYSQLMYFLNLQEGNNAEDYEAARIAYRMVAELIKDGRRDFLKKIASVSGFRKLLLSKFSGPGAERALDLLTTGLSLSQPLLEKKAIVALSSSLAAETIKVKFNGGKLVLQTSEGARLAGDLEEDTPVTYDFGRELQYGRTEINGVPVMYAEVVLPRELLTPEQLEMIGSEKGLFVYGDGIGFRIPSTELHSAIPLKVVGTYSKTGTNVVIAPKELVPIHGSDFDVDALFVITRENYNETNHAITSDTAIIETLDLYKSVHDKIEDAIAATSDPESKAILDRFYNNVTRKMKLALDPDSQDPVGEDPTFQSATEESYQNYISTPRIAKRFGPNAVVLKDQPNFSDKYARREFAKRNGLVFEKGAWRKLNDEILSTLNSIEEELRLLNQNHSSLIQSSKELSRLFKEAEEIRNKVNSKLDDVTLGDPNTPIGYIKNEDGVYHFNPNMLEEIDLRRQHLKNIYLGLPSEFEKVFSPRINKEIRKLTEIRQKYMKNYITETMLRTISNTQNLSRMVTPISFIPLLDAFAKIDEGAKPGQGLDLSDIGHKQQVYSALGAGQILVGAFANAVKVIAYLSRTGTDPELTNYLQEFSRLNKRASQLETIIAKAPGNATAVKELQELRLLINSEYSASNRATKIKSTKVSETVPMLNEPQRFSIRINGKLREFDRLAYWDSEHNFKVPEVFDTLINAAIDNLKLNYLAEARINVASGSTIVGLTSVGVPIDVAVQLFYQPIFDPLFSGKVNRLDTWLYKVKEELSEELEAIEVQELSDKDLQYGLEKRKGYGTMMPLEEIKKDPELLRKQLQALLVFERAYKIGEDIRNLADFMNIIRELDVFVEDIDKVRTNLTNNIGSVHLNNDIRTTELEINDGEFDGQAVISARPVDDPILVFRADFSLWIPNLFRNNPHLWEAYKTFQALETIISENFQVHSPQVRAFAKAVYRGLSLDEDATLDSQEANLAHMRRSLVAYLLSTIVWPRVQGTQPAKIQIPGTNMKLALSVGRTYSEKVADDLIKIRKYAIDHGHKNKFLDYVSVHRDEHNVLRISFKGGVNLNSADMESIVKGFMNLNRYTVREDGSIDYSPSKFVDQVSDIQTALMDYAIINYGLQFSSSNYSNYIPASMFKDIDESLTSKLHDLISSVNNNSPAAAALKNQFRIIYAVQQGERLPFVSRENTEPYYSYENPLTNQTIRSYNGVAKVGEENVYFDRRVKRGRDTSPEQFIKAAYENRTNVYKLVFTDDNYYYYQTVGRTSDIFFSPLPETDFYGNDISESYISSDYFDPFEFTLNYSDIKNPIEDLEVGSQTTVTSMTSIQDEEGKGNYIKVGQEFWISPSYNADRTSRLRVKLLKEPSKASGTYRGFIYKVEVVKYEPKGLQRNPGSRVAYQRHITREEARSYEDVIYLFGDNLAQKGKGGQAKELRGLANAIGIPTKKLPTMTDDAFFTDEEFEQNKAAIDEAFSRIPSGKLVVIPSAGLGTGLARLEEKAPKTNQYLLDKIKELAKMKLEVADLSEEQDALDQMEDDCNAE